MNSQRRYLEWVWVQQITEERSVYFLPVRIEKRFVNSRLYKMLDKQGEWAIKFLHSPQVPQPTFSSRISLAQQRCSGELGASGSRDGGGHGLLNNQSLEVGNTVCKDLLIIKA
jgi:hypothetical protein